MNILFEQYGEATAESKGVKMKLSETSTLLNTSMNKKAPDEKPKLILRNIYQREKIRVNKMTLKALEPGKIMIYLFNGRNEDGSDRYTHFVLMEDNLKILQKWLDENKGNV